MNKIIKNAKNTTRIRCILFEFDGIPIMSAGTAQFHCYQGVDRDLAQKNKRNAKRIKFRFKIDIQGV